MAKLSFLEIVGVALFTNVILWQATSSYSLGPYSSIVTEETLTTTSATPSPLTGPYPTAIAAETTTTGGDSNDCDQIMCYQIYAPVCGSDGQTYDNDCYLGIEECRTNSKITILHQGICIETDVPTAIPLETTTTGGGEGGGGTPSGIPVQYTTTIQETMTTTGIAPPTFPSTYTTPPTEESTTTTGTGTPSGIPVQFTTIEETTTTTGSTCNGTTCPPGKSCPRFCPAIYDPVCGSDGKTYSSVCSLQVQACTTSTSITVQHNGSCDDGCTGYECQFYGQCSSDAYNRPTCVCLLGCNKIYDPVCGSNNQTYPNDCELRKDSCQTQISITVFHTGSCDGDSNDCDNITCPLSFAPVCGSDNQTYAGECELGKVACQTNTNIIVLHPGQCHRVPPTFPSTYTTPPTEERTTTTGTASGKPCPRFCPAIYDPVCGSDGETYSSVCSLQVQACTTSTSITVQRNGRCDEATVTASTPANHRTKTPRCRKNKKDRRHRKDGL